MFNEAIKTEYIETISSTKHTKSTLRSLFNMSEPFENFLGKDLCEFTIQDFIFMFEQIGWTKGQTVKNKRSLIQKYVNWSISKKYVRSDVQSNIERLSFTDLEPKFNSKLYYKSIEDLIDAFERVYKKAGFDISYYSRNISYCALYWYNLTNDQLSNIALYPDWQNEKGFFINLPDGNSISISKRLFDMIGNIPRDSVAYKSGKLKSCPSNNYLFRTFRSTSAINTNVFESNLKAEWKEIIDKLKPGDEDYGRKLSSESIILSGMCYRIHNEIFVNGKEVNESKIMKLFPEISKGYAYSIKTVYNQIYH